jgi:hypothetical protein
MGCGLAIGLELGELMASGVVEAAGVAALPTAGAAQAQMKAIAARPTHFFMPVERTPHRHRYCTP